MWLVQDSGGQAGFRRCSASRTCGSCRTLEVKPVSVAVPRRRVLYFDFWRILCVMCIVITHADEMYAKWDIAAVQQWVLQIIMVISGTCYGMSRGSCLHLLHYQSRLLAIVSFASFLNWAACEVAKEPWWEDIGAKVCFQAGFIPLMNVGSLLSFPLKLFLDASGSKCGKFPICIYALATAGFAVLWACSAVLDVDTLMPGFLKPEEMEDRSMGFRCCTITCGLPLLATMGTCILPNKWWGVTGWILLALLYSAQVAKKNPWFGYWMHLVDIYNWSFFVQRVPLLNDQAVGLFFAQAWPIWAVGGGLMGRFPGEEGRRDQLPFEYAWDRLRFYCLEALFVVAFVVIPTLGVERTIPLRALSRNHLAWLNAWSLLAFCTHKAVYLLLQQSEQCLSDQSIPWGLIVVFSSTVPFYAVWRLCAHSKMGKQRAKTSTEDSGSATDQSEINAASDSVEVKLEGCSLERHTEAASGSIDEPATTKAQPDHARVFIHL